MNVYVCLLASGEGEFHASHPVPKLDKKFFVCLFVCLEVRQLCGTCQEEDEA